MLAELCYNLSEYFKAMKLSKAKHAAVKVKAEPAKKPDSHKRHQARPTRAKTKHTSGARKKPLGK